MVELTEGDKLEIWLALNFLAHCHLDDRERLTVKAYDLLYRLRREGKIESQRQST